MANAFSQQVGGTHYQGFSPQPAEWLHRNKVPFLEACAIKYLLRHKAKGGRQDLEKARHYIDLLIAMEYPDPEPKEERGAAGGELVGRLKAAEGLLEAWVDGECGVLAEETRAFLEGGK